MKNFLALLAAVSILGGTIAAHATPVTFNLVNGETSDSYTVTGTVTIDTTTGYISAANLVENGNVDYGTFLSSASDANESNSIFTSTNDPSQYSILVAISSSSYATPTLCIRHGCGNDLSSYVNFLGYITDPLTSGTLVPVSAATPEPSSLMLLGTGILSAAGVARGRFVNA
jgi:hypothetical protein